MNVQASYLKLLMFQKDPRLLSSLQRMGQQAEELSYQVNLDEERLLWEIYWDKFTETERIAATDYYVKTIVQYKDRYDEEFLRRAANREYAAPPMR